MATLIPKFDRMNGGSTPTGAVNRTIFEKLSDFVSVKDFGAVGDGTTDDTTAFQNAFNAVSARGRILVPAGNYNVTAGSITTGGKRVVWDSLGAFLPNGIDPIPLPGTVWAYRNPGYIQIANYYGIVENFAEFNVERSANYTGKSPNAIPYVNTAGRFYTAVTGGAADYEWTLLAVCDNSATSTDNSENVAAYHQTVKRSSGKSFAHVAELIDIGGINPTTSTVTQELDLVVRGADTNRQRIISYLKAGAENGQPATVDTGILLTTDGIASYYQGLNFSGSYSQYYITSGGAGGGNGSLHIKSNGYTSLGTQGTGAFNSAMFTIGKTSTDALNLMYATTDNVLQFKIQDNGDVKNANNVYGSLSDKRQKENVINATPKLEDINKIRVVNFNLKEDKNKTKQIGVIAQELEEIFPGMVSENTEGFKEVKYSVFVPMLIKAVQELTQKVNDLETKLTVQNGGQ